MSGTRATLRNTGTPLSMTAGGLGGVGPDWDEGLEEAEPPGGPAADKAALQVGGFGSEHAGGGNFLFGDGAVRLISQAINTKVYQQLGHRADGKLLTDGPTR